LLNKIKIFPTKFVITLFILFWQILSFGGSFTSNILQLNEENKIYRPGQFLEYFILGKETVSFDDIKSGKLNHLFKKNQKDGLNFGIQTKTIWIKLKIKNNTKTRNWVLTSEYPVADDMTLYKINDFSKNKRVHVGDTIGYKNREIKHNMFAFKLSPGKESLYIIKVIGKGSGMNYPLKLETQAHFIDTKADNDFIHGIYF
jgi:hypothetical protein